MGTSGKKIEINVRRLIRKDIKDGVPRRVVARHYRVSTRTVHIEIGRMRAEETSVEQENPEAIGV